MKKNPLAKIIEQQLMSPPPPKAENVSVKLHLDHLTTLDAMAAKTGKSRGQISKIILEMGILQMGYELGCLTENLQDFYTGVLVNSNQK